VTELHPQLGALVFGARMAREVGGRRDLTEERAGYAQDAEALGGPREPVARIEDVRIPRAEPAGEVPARAYWPREPATPLGTVVWLHGGGWYLGDLDGIDRVVRALANAAGAVCLSVDYRLAPEHPFPAALQDVRAALAWASGPGAERLGTDPARVCVGGDSAGANLAAAVARAAAATVRLQLLVYPALDATMSGASYRRLFADPILSAADMERCWGLYLGDSAAAAADPDASPLAATDLAAAAPALVAVAGHDVLRDDGLAYAEALRAAGVEVEVVDYPDMAHGFIRWGGVVERTRELIETLGAAARAAIAR
jgi:acetyl esterase